jgi:hypothetical protein
MIAPAIAPVADVTPTWLSKLGNGKPVRLLLVVSIAAAVLVLVIGWTLVWESNGGWLWGG